MMCVNKKDFPPIARDTFCQNIHLLHQKNESETLTIYRWKKKKNVVILSTMHTDVFADNACKDEAENCTAIGWLVGYMF